MARPEKNRRVYKPPKMKGFKPFGIPKCELEVVQLTIEEYESIRLVNYEMLQQKEAAVLMNVSRPTLTRIYNKALKNITKAFVEGKAIVIDGGNYKFEKEWRRCKRCFKLVEEKENHIKCIKVSDNNSEELIQLDKK
ncbi:DUF134 domain-containing protein [Lutibacter sp.]|uniref:DUF134 domain-containing protein n=1 Tax=Lutibacter sp. TaxID=1925666 RepID=UPI0034A04FCD